MENEKLLIIKNLIINDKIFEALRIVLKYRQDFKAKSNIDIEVVNCLVEKMKFVTALRYIEKYCNDRNLELKIFKELYNQITYKIKINEISYVNSVLTLALKKLKLDCKKRNILLNEFEMVNNYTVLKSYPRILEVGLTGACNLKCKMCFLSYLKDYRKKKLTQKQVNQIIEFIKYAEFVIWIGGEPLMYKNFEQLMDITHEFNTQQEIFTNALLLNERIIKKIVNYGIKLFISIDSVNKNTYENIRVGAKFDVLVNNILFLSNYRKLKSSNSELILISVLSRWNYKNKNNFIDILNFANEYGFTGVNINVDNQEKNSRLKEIYIQEFNLNREKIVELAKKYSIKLEILVPKCKQNSINKNDNKCDATIVSSICVQKENKNDFNNKFCIIPWEKLYVNFDSDIRINCGCPKVGNFSNVEFTKKFLFDEVWNGTEIRKYREKIINNDLKFISNVCSYMSKEEKYLRGVER